MLRLTQEWLGNEDPDLRRASTTSDDFGQALRDIMKYFTVLTAVRQANPTDDLASLIANGVIDGEPLSTMDRLSYYLIIATAGHDTTSYALAEAMGALLEHPEQEMRSLFRHLVPRLRSVELQRWRHAASLLRRSRPSGRRLVEGD